ncbi:hypothetical protein [Flavobacterium sp.]
MFLSELIKGKILSDFDLRVEIMSETKLGEEAIKAAIKRDSKSFSQNVKLIDLLRKKGYTDNEIFEKVQA